MEIFIYIIENLVNGKMYVGQTSRLGRRLQEHVAYNNYALGKAIKKYGPEKFDFVLVERCFFPDEADEREAFWVKELNTISPNGYNLRSGGHSNSIHSKESRRKMSLSRMGNKNAYGVKRSEETKRKNSEAHKGKSPSPKTREKLRKAMLGNQNSLGFRHSTEIRQARSKSYEGEGNPFHGKTHAPESIEAMRQSKLGDSNPMFGKHHTKETKRRISDTWSEDRRKQRGEKYSGQGNPFYGRKHTEETKAKIREARRKRA